MDEKAITGSENRFTQEGPAKEEFINREPMHGEYQGGEPVDGESMGAAYMDGQYMGGEPMDGQPMEYGQSMGGEPMGEYMDGQPMEYMDGQYMGEEFGQSMDGNPANEESFMVEQMLPLIEWVAEQMPGGFFIYLANEERNLIYINTAILRIFGCQSLEEFRELTGGSFQGMIHPEDYEAVRESIDHQIADASNENLDYVEYRIIRKDGGVRWVNDYGHFVGTPGIGGVHYVFLSDVTEEHIAEEENKRRAEVIEGLSIGFQSIFLIDLDSGAIRSYRVKDDVFEALFGDSSQNPDWKSILHTYAERYVLEPDREAFLNDTTEEQIRAHLTSHASCTVNYRVQYAEGNMRYMQMSVVRIGDQNACFHAVLGFQDITEQVLRVQRDAASRLRMEVELEKEKQAHEAKSDFLFSISHDIRTPMNAIVGFTDLAYRFMHDPDRLREYLDKVRESNEHMLSLIDNLLEMSQIDSGYIHLKAEACSLRTELDSVISLLAGQAESRGVDLSSEIQIPDTEVLIDIPRFRRIMVNLIDNAIKFTPRGGKAKVSAKAGQSSGSGYTRYEFRVSDTGVGISEEFSKHLFQTFEREQSSTRSGVMGTGLGLSIVKHLLDVMGGSIHVESKKGRGSTFIVSLPLKQISDGHAVETESPLVYAAKKSGEYRILLVEDIEINRMLAETILEEAGFLVESAPDGSDAVEMIENHPLWYFDLILMDIQMPVMNGYEATRTIRAMDRDDAKKIPIIALSANAREEDRRMSMESGMDSHIAKPFDMVRLITTINDHIGYHRGDKED